MSMVPFESWSQELHFTLNTNVEGLPSRIHFYFHIMVTKVDLRPKRVKLSKEV
jgi:hypothetical protein